MMAQSDSLCCKQKKTENALQKYPVIDLTQNEHSEKI